MINSCWVCFINLLHGKPSWWGGPNKCLGYTKMKAMQNGLHSITVCILLLLMLGTVSGIDIGLTTAWLVCWFSFVCPITALGMWWLSSNCYWGGQWASFRWSCESWHILFSLAAKTRSKATAYVVHPLAMNSIGGCFNRPQFALMLSNKFIASVNLCNVVFTAVVSCTNVKLI